MIVKNESAVLARCLESVKGVDEIFIADTGSIDNTVEIAKKYTKNVYTDYKWEDNFAKARNFILSKVTTDYVLSIDADEILHDISEVREAVEILDKNKLLAATVLMIGSTESQTFFYPRIFKKDPKVWWEGAIHNHISVGGDHVGQAKITHTKSPAHALDPNRALRILTKEVERTGNARETFYLAREYWYRGDYETCLKWLKIYVTKSRFYSEKAEAFLLMAQNLKALGRWEEARNACMQALLINAHFKEALRFMALLSGDGTDNPVWQANADQWKRLAETADNRNVLFIRN